MTAAPATLAVEQLADVGGRPPDDGPVLRFDTITIGDDAAAVAGTVSAWLALTADLYINGQPVPLDNEGRFYGVVRLSGYDGLSLWLDAGIHGDYRLELPLRAAC